MSTWVKGEFGANSSGVSSSNLEDCDLIVILMELEFVVVSGLEVGPTRTRYLVWRKAQPVYEMHEERCASHDIDRMNAYHSP